MKVLDVDVAGLDVVLARPGARPVRVGEVGALGRVLAEVDAPVLAAGGGEAARLGGVVGGAQRRIAVGRRLRDQLARVRLFEAVGELGVLNGGRVLLAIEFDSLFAYLEERSDH